MVKKNTIPIKAFALVLAIALCFSLFMTSGLVTAFADEQVSAPASGQTDVLSDEIVTTQAYSFEGSGTEEDPYLITSVEDMEGLQSDVTSSVKAYHAGEYFKLTADLTLDGWTGIGTSTTYSFRGIFDGDGHTITLDGATSSNTYLGLFNYCGYSSYYATIENLTVKGDITTSKARYCGGIVAYGYYCYVENCVSYVEITNSLTSANSTYGTGGIVGYHNYGSVTGCANYGDITASTKYVGGISGYTKRAASNCLNAGDITSSFYYSTTAAYYAGGISGYSTSTSSACVNTGKISVSTASTVAYIASINAYKASSNTACYTTYDVLSLDTVVNLTEVETDADTNTSSLADGLTYVSSFTKADIWNLNTLGGTADNSLFWALDSDSNAVFADDSNPAVVRVLYTLITANTTAAVYTTYGSTASAPEGYESLDYGDFVPGETIVYGDTEACEKTEITLKLYYETGSTDESNLYMSYTTYSGVAFTLPEEPKIEYRSFAGWVDADGNAVAEGDLLKVTELFATWTGAYDSETNTYTIAYLDDLLTFVDYVNEGGDNLSVNAVLAADIDAYSETWTMISKAAYPYAGTFDGNGHSIRLNTDENSLFGAVAAGGVVKNLTLRGIINSSSYAGGFAYYNYGTIENCVNRANISGTVYAGGIACYNYGDIINCGNEGDVTASYAGDAYAGGITALLGNPLSSAANDISVLNCYNWGDVNAESTAGGGNSAGPGAGSSSYSVFAGGIAGSAATSTSSTYDAYAQYITNCYSTGEITGTLESGTVYSGAIIGRITTSSSAVTDLYLQHCYYLDGSADAAYSLSNTSYDRIASESITAISDSQYSALRVNLNAYLEDGWNTWVADTSNDNKPAFGTSEAVYYTVNYIGDYVATVEVAEGSYPVSCTDSDCYYTFNLNTADGEAFSADTPFTEDCTLYVTKNYYQFTVTYNAGEGSGSVPDTTSHDSSSTVTVNFETTPTRDGYVFTGWTDDDGNFYSSSGTTTFVITKDTTLTAVYEANAFNGSGTEADPYLIEDKEDLINLSAYVTAGATEYSYGKYYKQTADITVTADDGWAPIGYTTSYTTSSDKILTYCEYDGNGCTINLTYSTGSVLVDGLFTSVNGSVIKDLTLIGSLTYTGTSTAWLGGIAAYMYNTTVENCTVDFDITCTSTCTTNMFLGGIAADVAGGSQILDCSYEGTISATTSGSIYAGGICGRNASGTIDHTAAVSDITAETANKGMHIGGIAGYISGTVVIENCSHQGAVNATNTATSATYVARAGGIVGGTASGITLNVINSYHGTGAITSTGWYVGGVLGYAYSSNISLKNCYSAASSVTSGSDTYLPGGVIGFVNASYAPTIDSCYYLETDASLAVIGYTTSSTDTSGALAITSASDLKTSLNSWVSENQTAAGAYETWIVDESEDASYEYPVFGSDDADDVIALISTIGDVTLESEDAITAARAAYDELNDLQKAYVTNYDTLTAAEAAYAELAAEVEAAEAVIEKIDAIPMFVTLSSEELITSARTAYDALSDNAKTYVTNLSALELAEDMLAQLKADEVDDLIEEIGDVTLESGDAITAARTAYDALSEAAAAYVTNLETLTAAESAYAALVAADEAAQAEAAAVDALIEAIGDVTLESGDAITAARTAYDALSEAAAAYVTGLETLTEAETTYAALVAADEAAQAEAAEVVALINAIGDVTLSSSDAITAARTAYDALSEAAAAYVTNLETLTTAESTYAALVAADEAAQAEAAEVIALINAIGDVTLESSDAITAARTAYDALSEAAAAYVTNLDILTAAESTYAALVAADEAAQAEAAEVVALINVIGDVTLESEDAITAARTAYDALSEAAAAYVTNLDTLTTAESTYDALVAAYETAQADAKTQALIMDALIGAIGTVTLDKGDQIEAVRTAYDGLSDTAQSYVTKYDTLTAAESTYAALVEADAAAQEEAAEVIALIDAIGDVTLDSSDAITAARTAYDALSEDAAAYVTNIDTLTEAESTYAVLVEEQEAADAAAEVIALIDAIGDVTLESSDAISAASAAYEALSDAAKALVTNADTLTAAESTYAALVEEQEAAKAASEVTVAKKAQTIKVKNNKKTIKAKKLKSKKQTFKLKATVKGKAKVTFKKLNKKSSKALKKGYKALKINKNGKVTVKKGTKKGTYKIKVKVTAKATSAYKAKTKTITVTVKVK